MLSLELSSSRMGSFITCPQKQHYQHTLGRVPLKTSEALSFGRLWHKIMEAWWSGAAEADRLDRSMAVIGSEEMDPYDRAKVTVMIAGYTARWGFGGIETVAVELPFSVPLIDPETGDKSDTWMLCGTIDKIVRKNGKLYIVEHKTSSDDTSAGSDYWRRLAIDTQVSNYYIGAKAVGYDIEGCLYDVVAKPALRPLKATPEDKRKYRAGTKTLYANQRENDETPEEYQQRISESVLESPDSYYIRGEVSRLAEALERARRDVWEIAYTMDVQMEAGMAPRNTKACSQFGRMCEYFDVCSGAAELTDPTRFKNTDYRPSGKVFLDPELGF